MYRFEYKINYTLDSPNIEALLIVYYVCVHGDGIPRKTKHI